MTTPVMDAVTQRRDLRLLIILSALMSFASVSTDLYLPAMPVMGKDLHAASGGVEFTLSGFLIGFSLGQLIWGPAGDRYGRRIPVALGLVLFLIGSMGCALSTTITQMVSWRVIQAVGACAGPVLARAMVRDLYSRERAAQMLSTLILFMAVAPLSGPILGGQIMAWSNWHMIFWFMVLLGVVAIVGLAFLPETLNPESRATTPLSWALKDYVKILKDKRVMGYGLAGACYYAGFYAFIAGTPSAYIDYYHVSPQMYGLLFSVNIIGVMGANFLNSRTVKRIGSDRLFHLGSTIAALAGVMFALDSHSGWGGISGLILPFLVYAAMNGLIVANSVAGALAEATTNAGGISSLIGAMHYGSGIFSAAVLGWWKDGSPWPMGAVLGAVAISGCVISWGLKRHSHLSSMTTRQ